MSNVHHLFGDRDGSHDHDQDVRHAVDYLIDRDMLELIGDGTDTVRLTPEGLRMLEVLLVMLRPVHQTAHPEGMEHVDFDGIHAYLLWLRGET